MQPLKSPFRYLNALGLPREVPVEEGATQEAREAAAAEARQKGREADLTRALRAMINAGERHEALKLAQSMCA